MKGGELKLAVVGVGPMGQGIAQVAVQAGFTTALHDADPMRALKAREQIGAQLHRLVEKGKLQEAEAQACVDRLKVAGTVEELDAQVVVEAIVERLDVKQALFRRLAEVLGPEAVLATNTSSLSVTQLAAGVPGPERVLGLHFFNPAPLMKLVEVVRGAATSEAVLEKAVSLTKELGKVAVVCRDSPGFVVNRVARPYYTESFRLLEEQGVDAVELDGLMRNAGFRMGPCELSDLIGHDVNFAVTESLWEAFHGEARFRPSRVQQQLVHSGRLGRKAGRGFYEY